LIRLHGKIKANQNKKYINCVFKTKIFFLPECTSL
jgi:hypothetical protein